MSDPQAEPSHRQSVAETLIDETYHPTSTTASQSTPTTNDPTSQQLSAKADADLEGVELNVLSPTPRPSYQKPDITLGSSNPAADEGLLHPTMVQTLLRTGSMTEDMLMMSLPPPPPFDMIVENLTIGVPLENKELPLPFPVPVPTVVKNWFRKKKEGGEEGPGVIVKNVSTRCASGEMLAIIGGSGSGKTTVLNAIVGRLSNLPVESGSISFVPSGVTDRDQKILTSRKMKDKIGFVKQQDTLLSYLTVRETLNYAATLRLPASISKTTREAIVNQTIEELGLRDAADTVVGGALRKGISGGERRRLSIGCALVSLPSVLVADESTTGLDAFTSYNLLLTLSQLARRNRTIILTLHQPRSSAFPLFDRILLLSRGRVVFSGHRERCLPWFSSAGMPPPDEGTNPLDWLIDISTVDHREDKEEESRERVATLVKAWEERGHDFITEKPSPVMEKVDMEGENDNITVSSHEPAVVMTNPQNNPSAAEISQILELDWDMARIGMWRQILVLLPRANQNVYRNYGQMLAFACQSIGLAVFLGISFFRLGDNPSDIQSLKTLSFQHLPYYTYLTLIYWIYKLCTIDFIIFDREREDRLYNVFPWLISEFLSTLPLQALQAGIFAILVYFISNLRPGGQYLGIFIIECILSQLATTGMAYVAASCSRTYATASMAANASQIFLAMSAGFLLIRPPWYYRWFRFISLYFYGFRAILISQFKNRTFVCEGVTGSARNLCDGNQVLAGFLIGADQSPGYYLAGLIGLGLVLYAISGVLLAFHHPGGVKHAAGKHGSHRGKEVVINEELDISRQRIDVEVRQLGVKWVKRRNEKPILRNINARFPSGQVTAVLGPSGAGKSTLLQILADRHLNAGPLARFDIQGEITLNGRPKTKNTRSLISFVEQDDDYHLPALTVRETLRYAAILRLPRSMTRKRKIQRAEEVLTMLGLLDCADNLVGGELLKGISGGEKRRLSLAVEMINDPSVLIVDEPTSGLDSMTANNVMLALKAIASSGRTVIVSIHQPRSDIWHEGIDNVILLAKGGRTAYSGPKDGIPKTCAEVGYPIPDDYNPADWILDLVSVDTRGAQEDFTRKRVNLVLEFWERREKVLAEEHKPDPEKTNTDEVVEVQGSSPIYIALPVIIDRMIRNLWRQQPVFWLRLQQAPLFACILLLCFQRLKYGPSGAQDRIGFVMQMVSPMSFVGVLNNIAIFPMDRDIYFHEVRSNGGYSAASFVLAFTLVELPQQILSSILFAVVTNVGGGMQTNARIFFEYSLCIFALQSNGESFGIMFGCLTDSMGFNVSLVSTFISLIVQICGVVSISIPIWLNDIAWATTLKYAARIILINESIGLRLNCPPETITSGECLAQTGEQLLNLYKFNDWDTSKFAGLLVAVTLGYRLLAWLFVRAKVATL